jgi:integrase
MLLLLRYSGLRISDAAMLERSKLTPADELRLYTQKTGQHVYVPLLPQVALRLRAIPNDNPKYFFWSGNSKEETPGKNWWSTLKKIFKAAGIAHAHPHMLRDTFAVEMLVAGVPLDQVSILLGHSSVKITEKHYLPWVKSRQDQLTHSVRKAWAIDPLALTLTPVHNAERVN